MIIIYAFLVLLLILILLDLVRGLRFRLFADLGRENAKFEITLLYPILKIMLELENEIPKPKIYILGVETSRFFRQKKRPGMLKLAGSLHASNIKFVAAYGLADPFSTGIVFGTLSFFMSFCPKINQAEMYPDFLSAHDYLKLNASVDIQVGHTILNYLRK